MTGWIKNYFRGSKLIAPFIFVLLFFIPINISGYFAETTHSQLTREAAKLFNKGPKNLSDQEINYLIKGAVDEDTPPRWINHFYDPITGEGWNGGGINGISPETIKYLAQFGLSYEDIESAKKWAVDPLLQNAYILYQGDQTWQKAITEYVKGNKKEAFIALGHVLHLLEDMTVPDHTRNDTHAGVLNDPQSPYEVWARNYTEVNELNLSGSITPTKLNTLDEYFSSLAAYSNKYFASADSIFKYPVNISKKVVMGPLTYVYVSDGVGEYPVYKYYSDTEDGYSVEDPKILPAYWQRLAPKAVGAGAGVIDLFFKEVEEAKNNPEKYETPSAPVALAINLTGGRLPLVSIFGELSRLNDAVNNTIAFFKNLYSGSMANEPAPPADATPAENSDVMVYLSPEDIPPPPVLPDVVPEPVEDPEDIPPPQQDENNYFSDSLDDLKSKLPVATSTEVEPAEPEDVPPVEPITATSTASEPAEPEPPVYVPIPHTPRMGPAPVEPSPPPSPPPPDTAAPTVSFADFSVLRQTSNFQISWTGEDNSGAVDFYDLDWTDASTTTVWQPLLAHSSSTSANFSGEDKRSYNFHLRATDAAGNVSAWVESGTTTIRVPHMVISEVQIGGKTAGDEFVELYNPGDSAVNLSGWKLQKVTGSGKTRDNLLTSFPAAQIPAHGFYLITHPEDYTGAVTPDATYSTKNSLAPNNSVVLYDAAENIVDTLGFGEVAEFETAPATGLDPSGGSLERKASANSTAETMTSGGDEELSGNAEDSDNNAADFVRRVAGEPQNSESAPEPREGDEAKPGAITDLRSALVEATADSVKLLWSTPVDAKLTGEAIYEVRYISQPSPNNCALNILWSTATRVLPNPVPAEAAGDLEMLAVGGLSSNTYYCFGIKTWNGYRWSDLSNLYVARTMRGTGMIFERVTFLPDVVKRGTLTLTPEENPYYVQSNTWIQSGAKLIIKPGVIIKFRPYYFSGVVNLSTMLMIDGELEANGTAENPIIFTSERDDRFGGDTDGDGGANPPAPGSWGAVRFGAGGGAAAAMDYARFYYGGQRNNNDANLGGAFFWQGSRDFVLKNSVFQNNLAGIYAVDTLGYKKNLRIENSEFSDNTNWNLLNNGANVETVNCTPPNP